MKDLLLSVFISILTIVHSVEAIRHTASIVREILVNNSFPYALQRRYVLMNIMVLASRSQSSCIARFNQIYYLFS
jgi:hypothetical protein